MNIRAMIRLKVGLIVVPTMRDTFSRDMVDRWLWLLHALEAESDECLDDLAHKQFHATRKFWMGFIRHQKSSPRAGMQ